MTAEPTGPVFFSTRFLDMLEIGCLQSRLRLFISTLASFKRCFNFSLNRNIVTFIFALSFSFSSIFVSLCLLLNGKAYKPHYANAKRRVYGIVLQSFSTSHFIRISSLEKICAPRVPSDERLSAYKHRARLERMLAGTQHGLPCVKHIFPPALKKEQVSVTASLGYFQIRL